jgi:hypothetical protein
VKQRQISSTGTSQGEENVAAGTAVRAKRRYRAALGQAAIHGSTDVRIDTLEVALAEG